MGATHSQVYHRMFPKDDPVVDGAIYPTAKVIRSISEMQKPRSVREIHLKANATQCSDTGRPIKL